MRPQNPNHPVQNLTSSSPSALVRKPDWLKVRAFDGAEYRRVEGLLRQSGLHTVCQEANCPNRGECFNRGTAVFLILGSRCTRQCRFCNVFSGQPLPVDPDEPRRVAEVAASLNLRHVVVTSVTRDDLPDGGAGHFAATTRALRFALPTARIELLIPDFGGDETSLAHVVSEPPDILNHNLETVPRLYPTVRPGASYQRSLLLLESARASAVTKSGLMVGLGETFEELKVVFADLAIVGVRLLTIGQYLAPSREHLPVKRFVSPHEFAEYKVAAETAGIPSVFSGPLVRSSYLADQFASLD